MGKRSKRYEEEERVAECGVCGGDIVLEHYLDRGDLIYCDECESEYVIKSNYPLRLVLIEDDEFDDEFDDEYDDEDFDDARDYD